MNEVLHDIGRAVKIVSEKYDMKTNKIIISAHPDNIDKIRNDVKWIINKGDEFGNVKIDYSYGVLELNGIEVDITETSIMPITDSFRIMVVPKPHKDPIFKIKWK